MNKNKLAPKRKIKINLTSKTYLFLANEATFAKLTLPEFLRLICDVHIVDLDPTEKCNKLYFKECINSVYVYILLNELVYIEYEKISWKYDKTVPELCRLAIQNYLKNKFKKNV